MNLLHLPTWRGEGAARTLDLLTEGYDATTKTFTAPMLAFAPDWPLEDAHAWLEATFGTPLFFETGDLFTRRSFAAHVAGMLGVFAVNLLPDGAVRPLQVVNGNQSGLGKTLLVHAQLSPVHGPVEDDAKPASDEELRNVLDAAAPYLVLDDAANLRSHDLNRFVTSPVHVPPVKGQSLRVRCANVTQVFAPGNALNLAEDLTRRAFIRLRHRSRSQRACAAHQFLSLLGSRSCSRVRGPVVTAAPLERPRPSDVSRGAQAIL